MTLLMSEAARTGGTHLDLKTVVCASENQVSSRVGDETAILDLDSSVYYGLDPVGARIFELLAEPVPLESVLQTVIAEYEIDAETARIDLFALVRDLLAQKLVVVQSANAP
jgi:hypothetical protein